MIETSRYAPQLVAGLNWKDYGGEGPTMVLVHGLGGSLISWDAIGPRLAAHHRVVALDLPGFGLSRPRPDFSLGTHALAVVEFISEMDSPATLVGNSMGGLVSELVAAEHPHLVEKLILVSPATPPRLPDTRLHWPTVGRLTLEAIPGVGYAFGRAIRNRYSSEEIVQLALEAITHDPSRISPEIVESLVEMAEERMDYPWAAQSLNMTAFSVAMTYRRPRDFVRMIRRIDAPALIVQGVEDRIVSPTAVEWLSSLRSDWELVQMSDTGHTPQLDAPIRFMKVVESWLREGSRGMGKEAPN